MKKCPFCAEEIQDEAIVCKHCHSNIPRRPTVTAQPTGGWRFRSKLLFAVFAFVGVPVVIVFVASVPDRVSPSTAPSDDTRATVLHGAIVGVGESCDTVTRVYHQGGRPNIGDFWNVACRNGKSYSVLQKPTGEVQVLSCIMMKVVAKQDCFVPF